jgi:metal-dependent hydrolase (beta-lactamase superfamily II)
MRIASLGSGSRGNATLVQHGSTTILVDNGFSLRQFSQRLQRLEIEPCGIDAVLLTHEHGDHSGGVQRLCSNHGIPAALSPDFEYHGLVAGRAVTIGELEVLPVNRYSLYFTSSTAAGAWAY